MTTLALSAAQAHRAELRREFVAASRGWSGSWTDSLVHEAAQQAMARELARILELFETDPTGCAAPGES